MSKLPHSNRHGYSLVEVMIVVAVIGVIATVAIPVMLTARNRAVDRKAQSCLRTVVSAEMAYYGAHGYYGDFASLESEGYLDGRFSSDTLGPGITISTAPVAGGQTYTCVITGAARTFSTDDTGMITET